MNNDLDVKLNKPVKIDPSKTLEIKNKYNYLSYEYNVIVNEHVYNEIVKIHNSIIEEMNNRYNILEEKEKEKNDQELKKKEMINNLNGLKSKKFKLFNSAKIKKLQNDILLIDDSLKNNSINISLIENRLEELRKQMIENENHLIELTGLNISKFYEILCYIKTNNIKIDVIENELERIKNQIKLYNILNYEEETIEELSKKTL